MLASVLNFDKRSGSLQKAVCFHFLKAFFLGVRGNFDNAFSISEVLVYIFQHLFLFPCADQDVHFLHLLGFFWKCLWETSSQSNYRTRAVAFHAVDHLAGLFISRCSNGAGIDNIHIRCVAAVHNIISIGRKLLDQNLCFILIHLASQGVKCCSHKSSFLRRVPAHCTVWFFCTNHFFFKNDVNSMIFLGISFVLKTIENDIQINYNEFKQ